MLGCEAKGVCIGRSGVGYNDNLDMLSHLRFHTGDAAHIRKSDKLDGSRNGFLWC